MNAKEAIKTALTSTKEMIGWYLSDLSDADLQGTAVAHETSGMQADGVFGVGDRLGRRRKQREIGLGTVEHRAELLRRQVARARHERQFGIDLPDQFE